MIVKRSIYRYDKIVGKDKSSFIVIAFKDEENNDKIKFFKTDVFKKEEYELIKIIFKETEDIYYFKRLDSNKPVNQEYFKKGTIWIQGIDTNNLANSFSEFSIPDYYSYLKI